MGEKAEEEKNGKQAYLYDLRNTFKCLREIIFCNLRQPKIIRIFPRRPNRKIGQNTFFDLEYSRMIYFAPFSAYGTVAGKEGKINDKTGLWGRGSEGKSYFE